MPYKNLLSIVALISTLRYAAHPHKHASSVYPHTHDRAELYSRTSYTQFEHAIQELPKLALTGSEKILHIGCKTGHITHFIAEKCVPRGQVVGMDVDPGMISFAQQKYPTTKNIHFTCATLSDIPDAAFDAVTSFWHLHWEREYSKCLHLIAQKVKPQGTLLICHVIDQNPLEPYVSKTIHSPQWKKYAPAYKPDVSIPSEAFVRTAIDEAGLTILSYEKKRNSEWVNQSIFQENILSLSFFSFIPEQERIQFSADVIAAYVAENPVNEKGLIEYWLPVITLVLQKKS